MPAHNAFRHQAYDASTGAIAPRIVVAEPGPPRASDEYRRRMQAVGRRFRQAGVRAIVLVHGTFVGDDGLGWIGELARFWPAAGELLRRRGKSAVDRLVRDGGNYTPEFAAEFEEAIRDGDERPIPVRLFRWSGENHHVGRADGAVRLIDDLADMSQELGASAAGAEGRSAVPSRFLLWGHSHAGNLFALVSNLLGGDRATRERFFQAAEPFFRWPLIGTADLPVWTRVEQLLSKRTAQADCGDVGSRSDPRLSPDFVTFGTPIRYGWDSGGYGKLLHFIFHRPTPGRPSHLATFPPSVEQLLVASGGDYVQQFGIAGTNLPPNVLGWRALLAEQRLSQLLQPNIRRRDLLQRLSVGRRVPDEGQTLLVDYGPVSGGLHDHVAGHAVYTRLDWLLFHAEQTARIYDASEA